jgi:DNA repair protein RadC
MYNIPQVQLSYVNDFRGVKPLKITSSRDAHKYFLDAYEVGKIGHVEQFHLILMNRNNMVLGIQKVSEGGVSGTVVDPKIIFQAALLANASAIILCHNHPSGNLCPSSQDLAITRKLSEAAKALEIGISDHIILSPDGSYLSFADDDLM